jgi:hypothetical protein
MSDMNPAAYPNPSRPNSAAPLQASNLRHRRSSLPQISATTAKQATNPTPAQIFANAGPQATNPTPPKAQQGRRPS